jgi:very-short-patch-repair endonuclease
MAVFNVQQPHPLAPFTSATPQRRRAISFALFAKMLRERPTETEQIMWALLCSHCPEFTFRRQWPLLDRIADFYCRDLRLVIEVDGVSHNTERASSRDADANRRYQQNGLNVLCVRDWHVRCREDVVRLVLVSLVNVLKYSAELRRGAPGRCVIVSFPEDSNDFRLV